MKLESKTKGKNDQEILWLKTVNILMIIIINQIKVWL